MRYPSDCRKKSKVAVPHYGERLYSAWPAGGRDAAGAETISGVSAFSGEEVSADPAGDRSQCLADVGGSLAVPEKKRLSGQSTLGCFYMESGKADPDHAGAGTAGGVLHWTQYESLPGRTEGAHVSDAGRQSEGDGKSPGTLYEHHRALPGSVRRTVSAGIFLGQMFLYCLERFPEIPERAASDPGKLAVKHFVLGTVKRVDKYRFF